MFRGGRADKKFKWAESLPKGEKRISAPLADLDSTPEAEQQEVGQKVKETSYNRKNRWSTRLNICAFECQHLICINILQ